MRQTRQQARWGEHRLRLPGKERPVTPSVELTIEDLVLHGFSPGDRHAIGDSFERELARLIAAHGLPGLNGEGLSVDRLDAGSIQVRQQSRREEVGIGVAESVFRRLRG
jgi:hypothetical protein